MTSHQAQFNQGNLHQAGIAGVHGNSTHGYMLFSKSTDGGVGRKVVIHASVAPIFQMLVNESTHRGQEVIRRIMSLRAIAGGQQSYSDANCAFNHMDVVNNVMIKYRIEGGVVWITQIDITEMPDGHVHPGLYSVKYRQETLSWEPSRDEVPGVATNNAAINGRAQNISEAANDIMAPLVESAYEKEKGVGSIKGEGYTLFYNPAPLYQGNKKWTTPEQKAQCKTLATKKLATVLANAQKVGKEINWTIHGDGSLLFRDAVKELGGASLDKHTVMFMAPTVMLSDLLPAMKSSGIKLHPDVMKYQSDDWTVWKNRLNLRKIAKELEGYGDSYAVKAGGFKHNSNKELSKFGKLMMAAFGAGGAVGTVGSQIAGGASLLSLAAGAHSALIGLGVFGAVSMYYSALKYRNIALNNSNKPGLNPHLNPTKGDADFNAQVEIESGGQAASFMEALRTPIR